METAGEKQEQNPQAPRSGEITFNRVLRWVIVGISIAAILYVLWYFADLVGYILISVVLSLIGKPLMNLFERVRIGKFPLPSWIGALVTLTIMWVFIGGVLLTLVPLVGSQVQKFSEVDSRAILTTLQGPVDNVVHWLEQKNIHFSNEVTLEQYINEELSDLIQMEAFSNIFGTIFGFMGDLGVAVFSISFITFFFLRDNTLFYKSILSATPTRYEEQIKNIIRDSRRLLTRYFVGISIQVFLITLCVTIGALICGVSFTLAVTMGLAAGLFNIIPYVGPILGTAFGILMALGNNVNLDFYAETMPLITHLLIVFVLTQILDNVLFQPIIFSNSVKAHPLELFLVIIIAGNLAGILGMILAIPGYTFIRIIAKQFFSNFKIVQSLTRNI